MTTNRLKAFAFASIAVLSLVATACSGKSNNEPVVPSSDLDIAKVVIRLQIGHLHGKKSFHYLPSEADLENRNLQDEQVVTYTKQGGEWKLSESTAKIGNASVTYTLDKLLALRWSDTRRENPFTGEISGSDYPQYGILFECYNSKGELLDKQLSAKGAYQLFIYPSDVKDYDSQSAITTKSDFSDVFEYTNLDTEDFTKSAHHGQTKFRDEKDPVNLKGYAIFPTLGSQMTLNFDLYATTKGKLEGGNASPVYAPNATVKAGNRLLHLSIPLYVYGPYSIKQYASTNDIKNPLRPIENFTAGVVEDEDPEGKEVPLAKAAAYRLEKILGKPWKNIGPDFTDNAVIPLHKQAAAVPDGGCRRSLYDGCTPSSRKCLELYEKKLRSTTPKALSTHVDLRTTHVDDRMYVPRL